MLGAELDVGAEQAGMSRTPQDPKIKGGKAGRRGEREEERPGQQDDDPELHTPTQHTQSACDCPGEGFGGASLIPASIPPQWLGWISNPALFESKISISQYLSEAVSLKKMLLCSDLHTNYRN